MARSIRNHGSASSSSSSPSPSPSHPPSSSHPPHSLLAKLTHGGVLAAAVLVFSKSGFESARVEDILAAAKIARRTFYKYFSSKEDVLASIYEIATGELLRAIRDAADSSEKPASSRPKTRGEPLAAVRRAMDAYLDYHVEHATLVRILVEQAIRSDSPLAPLRRRFREDVARLLDDAVFAVTKKRNDPFLYVALLSALEGVSLEMLTADSVLARGDDTRQRVNRAKDVLHRLLDHALSRSM